MGNISCNCNRQPKVYNLSYSFTGAGSATCSGYCSYCSAASTSQMGYTQFDWHDKTNKDEVIDLLKEADKLSYDQFKADFNKVEEAFDNDPQMKRAINARNNKEIDKIVMTVDYWVADPLTSISVLQEMHEFMKDYCAKREIELHAHTSTNGLPLLIDESCEWLVKENVGLQLSHDGLGQWIRTQDLDPLDFPNTRALIKNGTLNWINATLNFWNNDMQKNREYFTSKLMKIFPDVYAPNKPCSPQDDFVYRHLFIKLNRIYDSTYTLTDTNYKGLYNDQFYKELKDLPLGDISFHNDRELADKTGLEFLAHNLDDYIDSWYKISYDLENPNMELVMMPFRGYIEGQLVRNQILKTHDDITGACRAFQRGLKDTTFVIDTLGNYSQCNLIDSEHTVSNPGGNQAEYCKGCKYEFYEECNGCGSVDFRKNCAFKWRWNQMIDDWTRRQNSKQLLLNNERRRISNNLTKLII